MGIRLIVEVLDHCPTTLTHREKLALVVLAESARDQTRECLPGIENDAKIARRMKLPGRSSRYEVIQSLREKGVLEITSAGRKYSRAVYRITELTRSQGPENLDPEDAGAEAPEATAQGPENPDAETPGEEFSGSGKPGLRVRESRTQGPENLDPFPSSPSSPSLTDISEPALFEVAETTPAPPPDPTFEDFYAAYPKRKEPVSAARAYEKAIKAGASPHRILAGARAYAIERRGKDATFTKYPATWLNKGCFEEEPEPETPVSQFPGIPPTHTWTSEDYQSGF